MKTEFSTFDIVKILEIPRERLKDWMNNDFIRPTTAAQGKGTKAIFNRDSVYAVALFQKMISIGFTRKVAADFVSKGWDEGHFENVNYITFRVQGDVGRPHLLTGDPDLSLKYGVVKGVGGFKFPSENHPLELSDDWDYLSVINFKKLRAEVDNRIKIIG